MVITDFYGNFPDFLKKREKMFQTETELQKQLEEHRKHIRKAHEIMCGKFAQKLPIPLGAKVQLFGLNRYGEKTYIVGFYRGFKVHGGKYRTKGDIKIFPLIAKVLKGGTESEVCYTYDDMIDISKPFDIQIAN